MRNKEKYFLDDDYLNGYAKLCGVYATAVYNSLSRHANFNTQECFPEIDKMAEQHSMDRKTVIKGIKKLQEWNIISVKKRKSKDTKRQLPNVYILLDKSNWKPKPTEIRVLDVDTDITKAESLSGTEPSPFEGESRVPVEDCKVNKGLRLTNINVNSKAELCEIKKPLRSNGQELLSIFYREINPNIQFNNKSQRSASAQLTDKYGIEALTKMVLYIKQHQAEQYFPTVTTPIQLRDKMVQIINHANKQKDKKTIIII